MTSINHTTAAGAVYSVSDAGENRTFNTAAFKVRATNTTPRRALIAIAAALAVSFGVTSQAEAGLECQPTVRVTNKKPIAIKVLNFRYTVNGQEFTEGLANTRLSSGETHDWKSQNLQHVATGNVISSTRIEYRDDTSGVKNPSDPWGPAKLSGSFPHTFDCGPEHHYIEEIQ